jgi:hypothetical protein
MAALPIMRPYLAIAVDEARRLATIERAV